MLSSQLNLLLSRMTALAMGGAETLEPIKQARQSELVKSKPNWELIRKLYSTTGSLNLLTALVSLIVTLVFGYLALPNLLSSYNQNSDIWLAFFIIISGESLRISLLKWAVILRGTGEVALAYRYDVLFALASTVFGSLALLFQANIAILAVVVQTVNALGSFRYWIALKKIYPIITTFPSFGWDRQILRWTFLPYLRSLLQSIANRGSTRVVTIIFTRHETADQVASYLLAIRLFETLSEFSIAPLASKVPIFGRLLAKGDLPSLQKRILASIKLGQITQSLGSLVIILIVPLVLPYLNPNLILPDQVDVIFLAIALATLTSYRQSLIVPLIGNRIVAIPQLVLTLAFITLMAINLIPTHGTMGAALSLLIPPLIVLNVIPFVNSSHFLQIRLPILVISSLALGAVILSIGISISYWTGLLSLD